MKSKKWYFSGLIVVSLLLVLGGCGQTKTAKNVVDDDLQDVKILSNSWESIDNIFQSMNDEGLVSSQTSKTSSPDFTNYDGSTGSFESRPDLDDDSIDATVHILKSHDDAVELANYTSSEGGEDSFVYGNIAVHINGDISEERLEEYQDKLPEIIRTEYARCQEEQTASIPEEEQDAKTEEVKNSLIALKGHDLSEVVSKVEELGYSATYQVPSGEDRTADVSGFDAETLENWQMTSVLSVNTDSKTAAFQISTDDAVRKSDIQDSLEETFPVYYAWKALASYGKQVYPQGFQVHDLTGVYAEEAVDENTWFLKADVTMTTEDGSKISSVVEGRVSGDKNSQEVISFFVYD